MTPHDQKLLRDLSRGMGIYLSLEELKALARQIDLDWEQLAGDEPSDKTLSLVTTFADRGRFTELLNSLGQQKPEANLHRVPLVMPQVEVAPNAAAAGSESDVFQEYLDRLSDLLSGENLFTTEPEDEIRNLFEMQTLEVFSKLDGDIKGQLLRFLHDTKIIGQTGIVELRGALLDKAELRGEDLRGANLVGANLNRADLSGARLEEADLRGASLGGADLWGAVLIRADLSQAHLWGANLNNANLHQANLASARLSEATLWGADLSEANLDGASLWGANLEGANLRDARNLTAKQLTQVKSLTRATLPDGRRAE